MDRTKKMAALHFTTIPCELNTANRSHNVYFGEIHPSTNNIEYGKFRVVGIFCTFL